LKWEKGCEPRTAHLPILINMQLLVTAIPTDTFISTLTIDLSDMSNDVQHGFSLRRYKEMASVVGLGYVQMFPRAEITEASTETLF
jgi:hypothetical protein